MFAGIVAIMVAVVVCAAIATTVIVVAMPDSADSDLEAQVSEL
jgi:hypothetical protein